jgi:hypothetical protein
MFNEDFYLPLYLPLCHAGCLQKMSSERKGGRGESGLKLEMKDLPRLNELFCRRVTFLAKYAQLAEMKLFCRLG